MRRLAKPGIACALVCRASREAEAESHARPTSAWAPPSFGLETAPPGFLQPRPAPPGFLQPQPAPPGSRRARAADAEAADAAARAIDEADGAALVDFWFSAGRGDDDDGARDAFVRRAWFDASSPWQVLILLLILLLRYCYEY